MEIFLILIIAICVTAIYDARRIAEKYFSDSDKIKVIRMIKLIAFIVGAISGIVLCCINVRL